MLAIRCNKVMMLLMLIGLFGVVGCNGGGNQPPSVSETVVTELPTPTVALPEAKQIVLLYSYEPDFWATIQEDVGIVEGLATANYIEGENLDITRLYMNTKTINKTQEQMSQVAEEMVSQIEKISPDALVIMDDNALRYVGSVFYDTKLPVIFAGINGFPNTSDYSPRGSLADSLETPGHNITGILERISFSAGFELLHQVLPSAKTALFISDNSAVTNLLMADNEAELDRMPIKVVDKLFTNDFETLKTAVLDAQDTVDAIILFIPWTIEDKDGNHVPQEEVVSWFLKNNQRPGIAFVDILAEEGYLIGVAVDLNRQGFFAARVAGQILGGENPADIPIVDPIANRVMINLARANQLNIAIPFEVLSNADVVLKEMTAYPEYKMSEE